MTDINNAENLGDDLFAFKIGYDQLGDNLNHTIDPLYKGNIAETFWRSRSDNVQRKYSYQYDALNRLQNAIYQKPENTVPVTNMYNESMSYDKNGNITSLQRNGALDSDVASVGALTIDLLTYTYSTTNPNQLMRVDDDANSSLGFKNGTNTDDDYSYDDNGNMLTDKNKEITQNIRYNHLNLPVTISIGANEIIYLYTATGQKLRKEVRIGSETITTDYLNGFQYVNGSLQFFPTAEGYVNVSYCNECQEAHQMKFNYVYNYTDHLGNIRLSYGWDSNDNVLKILEENHYYPFGLKHTNYNVQHLKYVEINPYETGYVLGEGKMKIAQINPTINNVTYKYKYNGKEWQDELGLNMYDYGARNYDAALGRWMNIDPLAEKYYASSVYNYTDNDPINRLDPDGMDWYKVSGGDNASQESYKWIDGDGEQDGYEHIGKHLVVSPNKNSFMFFSGQKMVGTLDLKTDQGKKFALVALEGGFVNQNERSEWVKNDSGYDTGLKGVDGGKIVRETFSGLLAISASLENRLGVKSKLSMNDFGSDGKTYESLFGQYDASSSVPDFYNIVYNRAANRGGFMNAYGAQATIAFLWDVYSATRSNNAVSTLNTLYGKKGFNGNQVYAYAHNSFGGLLWNQRNIKIPFNTLIITLATADHIK